MPGHYRLRSALLIATTCCLSALASPAHAQIRLNLPAQPLSRALTTLGSLANLNIYFDATTVEGIQAPALSGDLSADDALTRLLAGTPLHVVRVDENTVRVVSPPPLKRAKSANEPNTGVVYAPSAVHYASTNTLPAAPTGGADAGASTTSSDLSAAPLQQVVVSAQKISENIQNVPFTVSAVSADRLASYNYTQLSDFASTIPGLQVDNGGAPGFQTVTIRGITTGNQYGSSTTAMYVNDVPVGPSGSYSYGASFDGIDLLPYDLDHVEVLKGPQGTLYGASSMGGLVKYVLSTPSLENTSFKAGADASYIDGGSGPGWGARAYGNVVAVPDTLAFTLSAAHAYTPGYIRNIENGATGINHGTQDGARLGVLWKPMTDLSVKLNALINHSDFNNVSEVPLDATGQPKYGRLDARYFFRNGIRVQDKLYSADIAYQFGWGTLTSVTGYFDADTKLPEDADIYTFLTSLGGGSLIPAVDRLTLKKFSQEVRLSSATDQPLQWVVAGFYTHERASLYERIDVLNPATLLPNPIFDPLEDLLRASTFTESAVYANATYQLLPSWDVTAGVRYSHDKQAVSNTNAGVGSPEFSTSDNSTTFAVSSRYHFTPDTMIYARVATGYRPGGSNIGLPGAPSDFSPDKLTNYELGEKAELLDRTLLLDAAAFFIDWKKIQLAQFTNTQPPLIYTGNAATAVSYGVELTTQYALTHELHLGLNVVYNNAKLTADAPAVGGLNGDRLPLSPQWSSSATADWIHPLTKSYSLTAGVTWRYIGDRNTDFPPGQGNAGGSNYLHLKGYDSLDLSLGVTNGALSARLYGRNLGNTYALIRYYAPMATVLQPRTVGLAVDWAY